MLKPKNDTNFLALEDVETLFHNIKSIFVMTYPYCTKVLQMNVFESNVEFRVTIYLKLFADGSN